MSHVPAGGPTSRRRAPWPMVAALAGLALLAGAFLLGWSARPSSPPTATTTITTGPAPSGTETPLPPPPAPGSGKPVGSIVLPQTLDDFGKTRNSTSGDVVQAGTYSRTNDQAAVRLVSVIRATSVAELTPPGATVSDEPTLRCWSEYGLRTCATDVDGGVIVVSALADAEHANEVATFLAALLKNNA